MRPLRPLPIIGATYEVISKLRTTRRTVERVAGNVTYYDWRHQRRSTCTLDSWRKWVQAARIVEGEK